MTNEIDIEKIARSIKQAEGDENAHDEDGINHPPHYNIGSIEVIDAIEDWGFGEGFNKGNAIKYIARAGHKSKEDEIKDLGKAVWYLNREIERLKKNDV